MTISADPHIPSAHVFPLSWRRGVYEVIARRRDMRHFLPGPVAPDVLARILCAAHRAGSVGFSQPWNFIVVDDLPLRQRLHAHVHEERLRAAETFTAERRAQYLQLKLEGIIDAPLNVLVTCDRSRFGPNVIGRNTILESDLYSTCGAVQNLWLAARAEGIGVGWVSILQPATLQTLFDLPEHVVPVAYLCAGHVQHFPEKPTLQSAGWLPHLPLEELVFYNAWGKAPKADLLLCLRQSDRASPAEAAACAKPQATCAADKAPTDGLLLLYTGAGKGKTTAALGLVFRALGRGMRAAVVVFAAPVWQAGERLFAQALPQLTYLVAGESIRVASPEATRVAMGDAWLRARALIESGKHRLVVLDEISYALEQGHVDVKDLVNTLVARPPHVHIVLTGHPLPALLSELADVVTEMHRVKHIFEHGTAVQVGIDF